MDKRFNNVQDLVSFLNAGGTTDEVGGVCFLGDDHCSLWIIDKYLVTEDTWNDYEGAHREFDADVSDWDDALLEDAKRFMMHL